MINTGTDSQSNKVTRSLGKVIFPFSRAFNVIGMVALALTALLIIVDVIGRYFFLKPVTGSYEILQFLTVILVASGLAYTAVRKGHIRINLVSSHLPPRVRAAVSAVTGFLCLGVFALITWQAGLNAENLRLAGTASRVLQIPVYPFSYVLAAGSAVLSLVFLHNVFSQLVKMIRGTRWLPSAGLLLLIILVLTLFAVPFWGQEWLPELSRNIVGILGFGLLLVLLIFGMPVAAALGLTGFLGIIYLNGVNSGLGVLQDIPYNTLASYVFAVIPLFLLMSALIQQSGIVHSVFFAADCCFRHLPGGRALSSLAAVILNAFAVVSGQSNMTAVGSVALPRMTENTRSSGLAAGSLAAGGAAALLIPPGIGFIVYALMLETSIIRLFLAGLIPGILVSLLFVLYVLIAGHIRPGTVPINQAPSEKRYLAGFILLLPLGAWIMPFAGMLVGIFTPVEAAAAGVLVAFILALAWTPVWGRPISSVVYGSLLQAVHTACMIGLVLIGAAVFGRFISLTGLPASLAGAVTGLALSPAVILVVISLVFVLLGFFLEPLAVLVISAPVLLPLAVARGYDPVWFGVVLMLLIGIGMLLSPYRLNLRLIRTFGPGISSKAVMVGTFPFAVLMIVILVLLVAFPSIAIWLPGLLY
jgi:tripartite ATP-independent transporter DctM subunit